MSGVRRLALAGAATVLGLGTLGLTATAADAASGCTNNGNGTYNCHVWKNAPSFFAGNVRAGTLYAGDNYFYCQARGTEMSDGQYHNFWYAKTDDDSGNKGVWVNVIYLSGGGNDEPVPGLPYC
ncbi:hypothetical protein AB0D08_39460 [Kitasatospora sp. NPDC048540]|uniref:hypothetical protein n=1 Tax=unclassified Kitasatospora TaxID=2633591 RepID=UPI00053B56A4|nr:hypothetical protein [Kitasatospora sp. MBT63]